MNQACYKIVVSVVLLAICGPVEGQATESTQLNIIQRYGSADTGDASSTPSVAFGRIVDVATGSDGIYVLDSHSDEVIVLGPDGDLRARFGGTGSGPGEFKDPVSLAATSNGVLVYDRGNARISHFDSSGRYLGGFPVSLTGITAITWAEDRVWVVRRPTERSQQVAWAFSAAGTLVDSTITLTAEEAELAQFGAPLRVATDPLGRALYIAGPSPAVWRLYVNGSIRQRGQPRYPDAKGSEFSLPNGQRVRRVNVGVRGVAVLPDGTVVMSYVHDKDGNTTAWLEHLSPVGQSIGQWSLPIGQFVSAVAVDGRDVLLAVTDEVPQIWRIRLVQHP